MNLKYYLAEILLNKMELYLTIGKTNLIKDLYNRTENLIIELNNTNLMNRLEKFKIK